MTDPARVAVVTGAAQGIGKRTAELLAERGFDLALIDLRHPSATTAAIDQCRAAAFAFTGDITREDVVNQFANEVLDRFNRVDVLVNNAGISLIRAAEDTTAEEYRRVIEVNLVAPFLLEASAPVSAVRCISRFGRSLAAAQAQPADRVYARASWVRDLPNRRDLDA